MADATRSQLLTRLNIKARDGGNVTFTEQDKLDALTTAISDPSVTSIVRDATKTTDGTDHLSLPDTLTTLLKLGIQYRSSGKPDTVDEWSVYGGTLYFDFLPPSGKTVVMIGTYKLTQFDAIPDNRQEYVLILAKLELVKYLQQSLANTFLTNDMTMGDLIQLESVLSREAEAWRSKFAMQVIEL